MSYVLLSQIVSPLEQTFKSNAEDCFSNKVLKYKSPAETVVQIVPLNNTCVPPLYVEPATKSFKITA